MTVMTADVKPKRRIQIPFGKPRSSKKRLQESQTEREDRFRYGFRYVEQKTEQGESDWVQIPLTLYDVLHPQVGDFIVHTWKHGEICDGLKTVCKNQWADRPGTVVLGDTRVDLNLPGIDPVGPDVALFFDVQPKDDWSTFNVAEEGSIPELIFEVTSPKTRHQDFDKKKEYYEQAGVPVYVIVDKLQTRDGLEFRIYGFELINGRYVKMETDHRGWLWLEPIQAWIAVDGAEINCYDSNEQLIVDHEEIKRILSETKTRVLEAEEAKQSAETRIQEVEKAKQSAETRAQEAEEAKQSAEARTQEVEKAKQSAETRAQEAEEAKQSAEARAQEAENAKHSAEANAKAMAEELQQLRALLAKGG